jgi:hypothetical protein
LNDPIPNNSPTSDNPRSLYADAQDEADKHKWIRSQEAGRDLGEEAVRDWVRQHWHDYLKARWLEHIQGARFWIELERSTFGVLRREFPNDPMLDTILSRLKAGEENLDIICWATDNHIPTDPIHKILSVIDINKLRLFRFFSRYAVGV